MSGTVFDGDPSWAAAPVHAGRPPWTYTASGPTTNVAARLAALAEGEGVIISEETRTRIEDGFDLDDLGPQSLKNVSEPIRAYRLT